MGNSPDVKTVQDQKEKQIEDDEIIEPNDILIIPFRQFFVSVAGGVTIPGRYPYIPDRDWNYYVGLAGGIDTFTNSYNSVTIVDKDGNKLSKEDFITPEATITVKTNSPWYKWSQISGGITAILTAVSTVLSAIVISRSNF